VRDADGVRGGDGLRDLRPDLGRLGRGQRAPFVEHRRQALGRQELHDEDRIALVFRHVEQGDRVAVLETCGDPGLPHGPSAGVRRLGFGERVADDEPFDRDGAAEPLVLCLPHHAHGSATDLFDQSVAAGDQCTLLDDQRLLAWIRTRPPT
jgi:hypothetical protein